MANEKTGIDKILFPEDQEWLDESYSKLSELFGSFDLFAQYIKRRYPNANKNDIDDLRGSFIIQDVVVIFKPSKELPYTRTRIEYGSTTLKKLVPDKSYSEEAKQEIRDKYEIKYAPVIKESHKRANALIWRLLSNDEKDEFKNHFADDQKILKEIFNEMSKGTAGR